MRTSDDTLGAEEQPPGALPPKPVPYGTLATTGIGVVSLAISFAVSTLVAVAVFAWKGQAGYLVGATELDLYDGDAAALGIMLGGPLAIAAILFFLRRRAVRASQFWGNNSIRPGALALWVLGLVLINVVAEAAARYFGAPEVPQSMLQMYRNSVLPVPIHLLVAVIIVGPLFEEVLFRGLLQTGWAAGFLRAPGAVLVSSLSWAAIHFQYMDEPVWLITILALGLYLGYARIRTAGLLVPFLLHAANNAVAMAQLAFFTEG